MSATLTPCSSPLPLWKISDIPESNILSVCCVYVDVWSFNGTDNRSSAFEKILAKMGATVIKKWTKETNLTHLIFKDGHISFLQKAKKLNVLVVGCDWVDECRTAQRHVDEQPYIYNETSYKPPKRFKEFQPLDKDARAQRSNERIQRIKNRENKKNTRIFFRSPICDINPFLYGCSPVLKEPSTILVPNTPFPNQVQEPKKKYFSPLVIPESPCNSPDKKSNEVNQIFTQEYLQNDCVVAPNTPFLTQKMQPNTRYFSPIMVPETPCETLRSKLIRINSSGTPVNKNTVKTTDNDISPLHLYLSESDASSFGQTPDAVEPTPTIQEVQERFNTQIELNTTGDDSVFNKDLQQPVTTTPEELSVVKNNQSISTNYKPNIVDFNNPKHVENKGQRKKLSRRLLIHDEHAAPVSFLGSPGLENSYLDSFCKPSLLHHQLQTGALLKKCFKNDAQINKRNTRTKRKRVALENLTEEYNNGTNKTNDTSCKENHRINKLNFFQPYRNRRSSDEFQSCKTTKKKSKKLNIVLTNFHRKERQDLINSANKFKGIKICSSVTKETTHVVSGDNRRTLSVIYAMIYGTWLVFDSWLTESLKAGEIINEKDHEMVNIFPSAFFNHHSKLNDKNWKNKILHTYNGIFYVAESTSPSTEKITEIIKLCGGKTTNSCLRATICIGRCDKSFWHNSQVPKVTEAWVLDCITQNKLLDTGEYIIKYP